MTGQITIQEWLRQKEAPSTETKADAPAKRESLGDADIDAIVAQLDKIAWMYRIKTLEARLTTWAHVPKMGRRLTYSWTITKEHLANRRIWQAVGAVLDYAEDHKIELEPMTGSVFFFKRNNEAILRFYSHFKDARKKIKGTMER